MALIVPKAINSVPGAVEGRVDRYTCYVIGSKIMTLPFTVTGATTLETPPLFVQGFTRFMGFLNCTGTGTLKIDYGICHPETYAVLGYRTLFAAATLSTAMFTSFGLGGQTVAAFQGDLATALTIKLSAATLSPQINELILWFGW
jgi:hypothetical protein